MLTNLCRPLACVTLLLIASVASASQPSREMTMQQVKAQFGAPTRVKPAVGNPPITRWVYPHYTVYFERQLVLDIVPDHATHKQKQATPSVVSGDGNPH